MRKNFAKNATESAHPSLWKNAVVMFNGQDCVSASPVNFATGKKMSVTNYRSTLALPKAGGGTYSFRNADSTFIDCANSSTVFAGWTGAITVAASFTFAESGYDSYRCVAGEIGSGNTNGSFLIYLYPQGSNWRWGQVVSGTFYGLNITGFTTQYNKRYRAVFTYDGTNYQMYVNGVLVGSGVNSFGFGISGSRYLTIGRLSNGVGYYEWDGEISEVLLYKRWFSPQAARNYCAGASPFTKLSRAVVGKAVVAAPPSAVLMRGMSYVRQGETASPWGLQPIEEGVTA